jgi:hypothetical protein
MTNESKSDDAAAAMRRINKARIDGQVEDLAPLVHSEIVMVFPGFAGRTQGREEFLAGFREFRQSATIQEFRDDDYQVDAVDDTAVVSFRFDMLYERSGERYRATGRDLWVFRKEGSAWIAAWRTMLDTQEDAV